MCGSGGEGKAGNARVYRWVERGYAQTMSESQEQPGENPSSEDLDVEAPNESAPGHNPEIEEQPAGGEGSGPAEHGSPPGSSS